MSLFIDDRTVIGVFALNQWFDIVPNSIRMDAYEFAYYQANVPFGDEDKYEKSLECYPMADMYPLQRETTGYGKCDSGTIHFHKPTHSTGFEFKCAKTNDRICFPITEIKAFRYKPELNTNLYPKKEKE
tara:strand:- start:305 stop:691 length:387 start_codon:yes stop_codon:yes gene_type:complete